MEDQALPYSARLRTARSSHTRQRHSTLTNLSLHTETHVVSAIPYMSTARDRVCHCVLYLADEGVAVISEDVVGDSSAPQERSTPL